MAVMMDTTTIAGRAQCQHGVMHLTLHLACTLDHTASSRCPSTCSDVTMLEPMKAHGSSAGVDHPNPAKNGQDTGSHLPSNPNPMEARVSERILAADQMIETSSEVQ